MLDTLLGQYKLMVRGYGLKYLYFISQGLQKHNKYAEL